MSPLIEMFRLPIMFSLPTSFAIKIDIAFRESKLAVTKVGFFLQTSR